jgi:hypothetical protein
MKRVTALCPSLASPQVRAGAEVSNDELVRFASLFNDELTLDNLDRVQLVSMCQLLSIPPFGTDGFLRNRLRSQLDGIKQVGGLVLCLRRLIRGDQPPGIGAFWCSTMLILHSGQSSDGAFKAGVLGECCCDRCCVLMLLHSVPAADLQQ